MIRTIGKENLKSDTIMYQQKFDYCNLIIGSDGVNFFKIGDNIIYDKSGLNYLENNSFIEEYSFDNMYLNFSASGTGHCFQTNYFLEGSDISLFVSNQIFTDEKSSKEQELILDRNQLEHIFDIDYYDSIFLMHRNGECEFAYDKKTGLEYKKETFNSKDNSGVIYGPNKFGKYSHFLITSFNNQFYIVWFKLEMIDKEKFKLTTGPVEIIDIDLEKVKYEASKYIKDYIPYDNQIIRKKKSNY